MSTATNIAIALALLWQLSLSEILRGEVLFVFLIPNIRTLFVSFIGLWDPLFALGQ
jgi:hypothetical protein